MILVYVYFYKSKKEDDDDWALDYIGPSAHGSKRNSIFLLNLRKTGIKIEKYKAIDDIIDEQNKSDYFRRASPGPKKKAKSGYDWYY